MKTTNELKKNLKLVTDAIEALRKLEAIQHTVTVDTCIMVLGITRDNLLEALVEMEVQP